MASLHNLHSSVENGCLKVIFRFVRAKMSLFTMETLITNAKDERDNAYDILKLTRDVKSIKKHPDQSKITSKRVSSIEKSCPNKHRNRHISEGCCSSCEYSIKGVRTRVPTHTRTCF